MDLSQSKVLITGGSSGIGKALANHFIGAGSRVIVTGRNQEKLASAAAEIPGLEIVVNDIGKACQREKLSAYVREYMPDLNVIINNAGIQRRVSLAEDTASWDERQNEVDILLSAPIHLNHLLIPVLLSNGTPSLIINVSSGGAFIPQPFAPVYSACKAALHHYTITLRHALQNTNCKVIELIPPAVQTGLADGNTSHGTSLDIFADSIFRKIIRNEVTEVGYGVTENLSVELSGRPLSEWFTESVNRSKVTTY